jgi:hypothetical protein
MIINDRSPYYILEGDTPVPVNDLLEWGRWFDDYHKRIVARTYLSRVGDELPTDDLLMRPADTTAMVSTVFLGTDHGYRWLTAVKSPPILFETMIEVDGAGFLAPQWRYATAARREPCMRASWSRRKVGYAQAGHWLLLSLMSG